MDKSASPVLLAYAVKGTQPRRVGAGSARSAPAVFKELDMVRAYLAQDVDCSYLVTVPCRSRLEDEQLLEAVKERRCFGLIFVEESNGKPTFRAIRDTSGLSRKADIDRKKAKLTAISLNERGCRDIRRQEWAREAKYIP
jgi:hypothetical protein